MVLDEGIGRKVFNICNIAFMIMLIIATLYPMIYVLFASLSNASLLIAHDGFLFKPLGANLNAYRMLFKNPMIVKGYGNTIFIVVVGVIINIVITSLAAYVLSRKNVFFNVIFTKLIVFTMFFSGGLIPLYFTVRGVGLYNSIWALILPTALSTYNLIIMRTSFKSIPDSLEESAIVDGANHTTVLFKIVMPLSLPVIAVMILYYGVAHWNSWFNAMLFLKDRGLYPIQLILREILVQNETSSMIMGVDIGEQSAISETIRYAVIVVVTLPILALYPFLQKYFVKGVMIGAIKG